MHPNLCASLKIFLTDWLWSWAWRCITTRRSRRWSRLGSDVEGRWWSFQDRYTP